MKLQALIPAMEHAEETHLGSKMPRIASDFKQGLSAGAKEDLLLAEYLGKMTNLLRVGRLGDAPAALQHVNVEETQRRQTQDYGVRTVLQLGEEHRLILANVFRAKLIGRATKVPAEVCNTVQVAADGCFGEVAALQLLKHELT